MSFEGYWQILCKNGHYDSFDVYFDDPDYWKCDICGEPCYWLNLVDYTNGSWDKRGIRIDGYVELEIEEEFLCTCDKCGSTHEIDEPIYKVPTEKGRLYGHTK